MRGDVDVTAERRTGPGARPRPLVVAMVVVVFGSLLIVAVSAAGLLGAAALLVWVTGVVGSWLGLPAMALLVAVIGIAMCVLVLIAYSRIVEAIEKPFKVLGDLTDEGDPTTTATTTTRRAATTARERLPARAGVARAPVVLKVE